MCFYINTEAKIEIIKEIFPRFTFNNCFDIQGINTHIKSNKSNAKQIYSFNQEHVSRS